MRLVHILLFIVFLGIPCMAQKYRCLSSDVNETDIVEVRTLTSKAGKDYTEKITVKDKLNKMKSRCAKGKLVDGKRREIRFYFLQGCWGNPPANYLEILNRQNSEIEQLKKQYTVIEMQCNRGGIPPQ